ncbi:LytR/AlgR family response regulator transcription factor [Vallitalea sp.]|uniref:LytR/AlgR family response regulator transcription factor n=1 Tax=Vallitalea sp. TaxID=1882829 RepID=UPI0025FCA133|nr:LytTR family DNA-binding domain-containing protein [Vallitalea sp.]MCT4688385.1 LytTR family DNA-binding domain-containing protein [Vallitalea sp.]
MYNVLIVEDNDITRNNLEQILIENIENLKIYTTSRGEEAIKIFKSIKIDIFLLDIQLPDVSGLKLAEQIREIKRYKLTYILFITTHAMYISSAVQKYHCYDYIEKPFKQKEIIVIIKDLIEGLKYKNKIISEQYNITIQLKNIFYKINVKDIYFAEILRRKIYIHTNYSKVIVTNMTLQQLLDKIKETGFNLFIKTHRSYIVNLRHINNVIKHKKKAWDIVFNEYEEIAHIGENYKKELIQLLSKGE